MNIDNDGDERHGEPVPDERTPARWERARWLASTIRRRLHAWRRMLSDAATSRASAALSALLAGLLVAIAGGFTILPLLSSGASGVVEDYLNALRDKDVEAALDIAGATLPSEKERPEFLTEEALSSGWRVDSVRELAPDGDGDGVTVAATISDESGRVTRGTFHVVHDGIAWRVETPFVEVSTGFGMPLSYIDLNGVSASVSSNADGQATDVPVFPGSYRLYAKSAPVVSADPSHVLLLPSGDDTGSGPVDQNLATSLEVTKKGKTAVRKSVKDLVDDCAATGKPNPTGCPFAAVDSIGYVDTGSVAYENVKDVSWEVTEYPDVDVTFGDPLRGLASSIVRRDDVTIKLTATGVEAFGDEKRVDFTADCGFDFEDAGVSMSTSGGFSVSIPGDGRARADCRA